MVRGRAVAVTRVPGRYQWADTQTTARGRGRVTPSARQAREYALSWIAFIGLPWPRKRAGSGGAGAFTVRGLGPARARARRNYWEPSLRARTIAARIPFVSR